MEDVVQLLFETDVVKATGSHCQSLDRVAGAARGNSHPELKLGEKVTDTQEQIVESQSKRARIALSALAKETVLPFLDRNKLVRSGTFAGVVEMAVREYNLTDNNGYVNQLLMLLRATKHEEAMVQWLCARAGFKATIRAGHAHLVKSNSTPDRTRLLSEIFPEAVTAHGEDLVAAKLELRIASGELRVEKRSHKKSDDIMDSKARLPGSFGSGKRR